MPQTVTPAQQQINWELLDILGRPKVAEPFPLGSGDLEQN